jgi:hypothetical protein
MSHPVTESTENLLDNMPTLYAAAPIAVAVLGAMAEELDRLEEAVEEYRLRQYPQNADAEWRSLEVWERLLRLPVLPNSGDTARRALILAAWLSRDASGRRWSEAIDVVVGFGNWTVTENDPSAWNLTLDFPYASATEEAGAMQALVELITPAHLDLNFNWNDTGFLVGTSLVGEDTI